MFELMTASMVRQQSLLKDAERHGMLRAPGPRAGERIVLQLGNSLISAGTRLREWALPEMPVQHREPSSW